MSVSFDKTEFRKRKSVFGYNKYQNCQNSTNHVNSPK